MFLIALTQRAQMFLFIILMGVFSISAYSQEADPVVVEVDGQKIELESDDLDMMANEVEAQAEVSQDSKTKAFLKKIANEFKKTADKISQKLSPSDERKLKRAQRRQARKDRRAQRKADRLARIQNGSATGLQRALYGIGKGASAVSTAVARPFVNSAGFLTGFFQKESKNQDSKNFLKFFLNHEEEFDPLYKNTGTVENFAYKLQGEVEDIMTRKSVLIISDAIEELTGEKLEDKVILKTIGISPYTEDNSIETIGAKLRDKIFKVDQSKFSADLINEHPAYQELRPLLGDIKKDQLAEMLLNPHFEADIDFNAVLGGSRIQLHEGLIAFSSRLFLPKLALGLVSKSLGSIALGVTLAADIGTAASVLMCTTNKENIQKLQDDSDEELKEFCSYVVNRSAYLISKSRAKGFVAGKNTKKKFNNFLKKTFKSKKRDDRSEQLNRVQMM